MKLKLRAGKKIGLKKFECSPYEEGTIISISRRDDLAVVQLDEEYCGFDDDGIREVGLDQICKRRKR